MSDSITLILVDLTRPELVELERELGKDSVRGHSGTVERTSFGALDPSTATVMLTIATMTPLALFLLKNRRGPRIHRTVKITRSDGTVEERVLDVDLGESHSDPKVVTAADPLIGKVVSAISSLTGIKADR